MVGGARSGTREGDRVDGDESRREEFGRCSWPRAIDLTRLVYRFRLWSERLRARFLGAVRKLRAGPAACARVESRAAEFTRARGPRSRHRRGEVRGSGRAAAV